MSVSDGHFGRADLASKARARLSYERAADLSLGCWLLRCAGSCHVLDGLGQQQVPGWGGVDVAGPVGKLDQQSRRAWGAPEGRGRPFEGGEAVGDLPAELLGDRRDRRVQYLSAGHLGRITVVER